MRHEWFLMSFLAAACLFTGCGRQAAADAKLVTEAAKFLLNEEPANACCIADVRQSIADRQEIVVFGRIGGVPDPWTPGRAAFVIADPAVDFEAHEHECSDACAFCKTKQDTAATMALVQFLDDSGNVLTTDARKLFNVTAGQMVVVRGHAGTDAAGHLVISATGLYVRR